MGSAPTFTSPVTSLFGPQAEPGRPPVFFLRLSIIDPISPAMIQFRAVAAATSARIVSGCGDRLSAVLTWVRLFISLVPDRFRFGAFGAAHLYNIKSRAIGHPPGELLILSDLGVYRSRSNMINGVTYDKKYHFWKGARSGNLGFSEGTAHAVGGLVIMKERRATGRPWPSRAAGRASPL